MKKFTLTVALLFSCLIILSGCGRDPASKLVGKWVIDDNPDILTMEFFMDGRVQSTYKEGVTLDGTWKLLPDKTIIISLELWEISAQFAGTKLILKSDNKEKIYRKIK